MGIKFLDVDASNVFSVIAHNKSPNLLKQIDRKLINQEVCFAAVRANGLAIKDVPPNFNNKELRAEAISNDRRAYFYTISLIDNEFVEIDRSAFNAFISHYKKPDFLRKLFM